MNFFESVRVAINAIWVNKMRSLLTMLGIIIGVSSVISVVALGQGSKEMIGKEFETFGVNRAYLTHQWGENPTERDMMNHGDVEALRRIFEDSIAAMSPSFEDTGKISTKKEMLNVRLIGGNESYGEIVNTEMLSGRYLMEGDIKATREVAVIDETMALKIFGRTNVVGESIMVQTRSKNVSLVIIGLCETPKVPFGGMGMTAPMNIYLPISTLEKIFGIGDVVYGVELNLKQGVNAKETLDNMVKYLERRHDNAGQKKYRTYTAESELEIANKITGVLTTVVGAIAAISLLVGGIGVMNIMLVSVTERTREIGIRKAIGAKHKDILLQFLVEAVIISGIGGVIGTLLGIGFSLLVSAFIKIPPSVSIGTIILAWTFSAGVGIFFGIYPANKAAKLDPIEALRYE